MAAEVPSNGLAGEAGGQAAEPEPAAPEPAAPAEPGSPTGAPAPAGADSACAADDLGLQEGIAEPCSATGPTGDSTEPAAQGGGLCRLLLLAREDCTVAVSIQLCEEEAVADAGQAAISSSDGSQPPQQDPEAAEASQAEGSSPAAPYDGEDAAQQAQQQHLEHLEQLRALQDERAALVAENELLQRLARQHIDRGSKASKQSWQDASNMAGIEQRYTIGLQQLQKLLTQRASAAARVEAALAPEKERLAAAQGRAEAHRHAFYSLVGQVSQVSKKSAAMGQGKGAVSDKALKSFLEADPLRVAEVQSLRLRNAQLQHRIASVEQQLKDSERLSDGLHLIDFEQLKIENSTLSYKIEARSAEVLKLRTKLTQTIQMAAHAKEKLHSMEQEKRCLEAKLMGMEGQLQQSKVDLAAAKARREQLASARAELKKDWQIITDRRCLADLGKQKSKLAKLQAEQARLKQVYEAMVAASPKP